MPLAVVGVSHLTAPLEVRERLALGPVEASGALDRLVQGGVANEAVLLSTCNRTEIYLSPRDRRTGETEARALLAERVADVGDRINEYLYVHHDRAAVDHLFRVTAGLDSMILGEPQIQGQVRQAYEAAREASAAGTITHRLFQSALGVGGRVRSETELGIGAASVSSAALELARKIFGSLHGRRALVIGAGEMSEATLEILQGEGVRSCVIINRTFERARELAESWGGRAAPWADLEAELMSADIVVCSTAAAHPVITRETVRAAFPAGIERPLCILDIAIPRDVEPAVGREANVFLYNIDDLRQIVDGNLGRRRAQMPKAEGIVAEGVNEFWSWYAGLAVVPTIRDLRDRGETVRQLEMARMRSRLDHLSPADRDAVDALTRSLLSKLLHAPTVRMREAAGNGRGTAILETVRYLFDLDAEPAAARPNDDEDASADSPLS